MPIDWKEDFETNDPKIDDQHRLLFRFTNKLETFLSEDHVSDQEVDRLLRFLEVYVKSHFQYEEACMLKRRCPHAKANRAAHQSFLEFFEKTVASYQSEGFTKGWLRSLHDFLQNWLTSHICHIDAQLRHCGQSPVLGSTDAGSAARSHA